jgi:L-alanine-DL-glutamate epimerase-like enolase superfamily enzyme
MLGLKPTEEQVRQAKYYFGQGFRAINLRTHRPHVEEDLEVIQAVRAAVGSEMEIMVDANQAWNTDSPFWNVQTALRVARELEKLNVAWLKSMVQGYFNYHAVPGNTDSLGIFRHRVTRLWR